MAISQVVAELWRFFDFKDAAVRHLGFLKVRILTAGRVEKISVLNFAAISQTVAEIWRLFDFSTWRPPPSWILKIWKF